MGASVMNGPTPRPLGLLAELTYACPLHCPYCSNPLEIVGSAAPLTTAEWEDAIVQAAELGVVQCSFSGGEPLLYRDLDALIRVGRAEGLYANLITSGVGLTLDRAVRLKEAGLDNVQISFQADRADLGDPIAGARGHGAKLAASRCVREAGLNLSLNVVLHRFNIERIREIAWLAGELGATRIELAHVQFYGWAHANMALLLPTLDQVRRADTVMAEIREAYRGSVEVLYVKSDVYESRPKACMGGWGQRYLTIDPSGFVLPCPTARSIPDLVFANVREAPLRWIWEESEAFQMFRGYDWMREPCRSCEFRTVDFGGCRCQAALITGDAANTDPVCTLSPRRAQLDDLLANAAAGSITDARFRLAPLIYDRPDRAS